MGFSVADYIKYLSFLLSLTIYIFIFYHYNFILKIINIIDLGWHLVQSCYPSQMLSVLQKICLWN